MKKISALVEVGACVEMPELLREVCTIVIGASAQQAKTGQPNPPGQRVNPSKTGPCCRHYPVVMAGNEQFKPAQTCLCALQCEHPLNNKEQTTKWGVKGLFGS